MFSYTFFEKRIVLAAPPPGEKKFLIGKGRNAWPFEIQLPALAPPTFTATQDSQLKFPAVSFTAQASLNKSLFSLTGQKTIIFRPLVLIDRGPAAACSQVRFYFIMLTIVKNSLIEIDNSAQS